MLINGLEYADVILAWFLKVRADQHSQGRSTQVRTGQYRSGR